MGDVLPVKKQIVVERLKRRFELYRGHQNACLPRYEQATNGLNEAQRQETILLKQRFLEAKAKKAKNNKSDHHRNYKEPNEGPKLQLHTKSVKRPAEEAIPNASTECPTIEDNEKPPKLLRTETIPDKSSASDLQQQSQASIPGFSVQIVQQFTKTPHSQHSQTIQTNVTVQPLAKPAVSPLPQTQTVSQSVQESTVNQTEQNSANTPIGNITSSGKNIECKQEKDSSQSDLCQYKNTQDCHQQDLCDFKTNQASNCGGDRLSDTFPSLGFTDESGDDVIHPDILKDLIDDVFTNSVDIMKDFNFDDSVGSMKDHDDATKDIIDLMKGTSPSQLKTFQTDSTSVTNAPSNQNQQNGLFRNISSNNEATMSLMSTTTSNPVTTASSFFNTPSQRMASYSNSGLSLPNGLGLDFKLTEPSPAALTLKQMAEQHQNMQQKQHHQQLINSPLSSRPSPFNQDSYSNPMSNLRPVNYLNGTNNQVNCNSPKTSNAPVNMFNTFDRQMNNFSAPDALNGFPGTEPLSNFPGTEPINPFQNCEPISPNLFEQEIRSRNSVVIADADRAKQHRLQMETNCHPIEQQKPPAYGATRPLTHYSENVPVRHPAPSNQQQRIVGRQFQNNLDIRMQIQHPQHMHEAPAQQQTVQQMQQNSKLPQNSSEFKQHHNLLPQHSNVFGNYNSPQPMSNQSFQVSVSQSMSYSTQFTSNQSVTRPPPEYKSHHTNIAADNLHIVEQLNASSPIMYTNPPKSKYAKAQRAPNVTITPDGSAISSSGNWRHSLVNPQHHNQYRMRPAFLQQENFHVIRNEQLRTAMPSPMFNQYRIPSNQVTANRIVRPNMMSTDHMLMVQRQRASAPQRLRNPNVDEINHSLSMNNNPLAQAGVMNNVYSNPQDMNRQDGSQINLDFLDNIESSASDLLNFDQVMQGGETHFPLLEDMEMFNK